MKVTIDREGCIGCGLCEGICLEVFCIADDGKAEVYAQPDAAGESGAIEAAESCPVHVIKAEK